MRHLVARECLPVTRAPRAAEAFGMKRVEEDELRECQRGR